MKLWKFNSYTRALGCEFLKKITPNQKTTDNMENIYGMFRRNLNATDNADYEYCRKRKHTIEFVGYERGCVVRGVARARGPFLPRSASGELLNLLKS